MTTKDIYVNYKDNIYSDTFSQKRLSEVIQDIKNGCFKETVENLNSEPDEYKKINIKKSLPLFIPNINVFDSNCLSDTSIPTGLVQFDLDIKSNSTVDVYKLKKELISLPEVYYCFISPRKGLKFAVLTDFQRNQDEDIYVTNDRFKQAYKICHDFILKSVDDDIVLDVAMGNGIKTNCFVSHDDEAYLNEDAASIKLNDRCVYEVPSYSSSEDKTWENEEVEKLLSYVPRDFDYDKRLPINFAVFSQIGSAGIPLLLSHWTTNDRQKLKNDLESQELSIRRKTAYGNIWHLFKVAKEHDYQPKNITGSARTNLRATPVDYPLSPLLSLQEAEIKLTESIDEFFTTKENTFLNVSTGFGKTESVLNALFKLKTTKKVLYLVGTHDLAKEIYERFLAKKKFLLSDSINFQERMAISSINMAYIKGRNDTCERQDTLEYYEKEQKVIMPWQHCQKECIHKARCEYVLQFDCAVNIRLMTHQEFTDNQSAWFNGSEDGIPSSRKWIPDYIIVDENWIKSDDVVDDINSIYPSISRVVSDCATYKKSIKESVEENIDLILHDYDSMLTHSKKYPKFESMEQYIRDKKKIDKNIKPWTDILNLFRNYIIIRNEDAIKNIRFDERIIHDDVYRYITLCRLKKVQSRYLAVPTLFLDATADEMVISSHLVRVKFKSIKVKSKEDINIFQAENFNITNSWLKNEYNRNILLLSLRNLLKKYKNPGIITYKNVKGIEGDFNEWLASNLGVSLCGYFGNIRGLDIFNDVDCLIVVGRYMLPIEALEKYGQALFGGLNFLRKGQILKDMPYRMKSGQAMTIKNEVYVDERAEAIVRHFSDSETLQAIGRGRFFYGSPKDIYFLSKESMGTDIEITSFIRKKDFFIQSEKALKYANQILNIERIGFCQDVKASLKEVGFNISSIDHDRKGIDSTLIDAGLEKMRLVIKNKKSKVSTPEFYVYDFEKLKLHFEEQGKKILDWSVIESSQDEAEAA